MTSDVPKWYQELSIPQMNRIRNLSTAIKCDFDEKLTIRTRKVLTDIGIISTFVKISPNELKKIFKKSQTDPGRFLCEIYRSITGNYFEEERNKKFYDCNQRLVLTAIAFLYLPETIIELHRRLPITKKNDSSDSKKSFPPAILRQKSAKSPYLKSHLEEYNVIFHKNEQLRSKKIGKLIGKPRVILPPSHLVLKSNQLKRSSQKNFKKKNSQSDYKQTRSYSSKSILKKNSLQLPTRTKNDKRTEFNEYDTSIVKLSKENKENKLPIEFEGNENNCPNTLGSKEDDFFIPSENFLKINETKYPRGRESLSRHWQESLQNVDEDFAIMSKRANDILNNVYNTTRTIFNIDVCSHCCTQKSKIPTKKKETKNLLIDSLILDGNRKRKFIGSLTLNSPPRSLPVSEHNLSQQREIILSEDKLIKKNIIYGTIIMDGKTINQIGGILKDRLHISHKILCSERTKNTSPCNCYCTEDNKEEEKEEENQTANKIHKLRCQQCFDTINPSLKNFLLACEARGNMQKPTVERIDHTTCTQRFYIEKENVEEKKAETCTKCINFADKCKRNPLEEIQKFHDEETLKEGQIKIYKENIKFSISGMKQIAGGNAGGCQPIISNIALFTPTLITPDLSESDATLHSSLSQNNHRSETKLNFVNNDGRRKLFGKDKIAKMITGNNNKVKEEMMELYKQIEELGNIKNKLHENLEIIKTDPPINDSKHVIKKRSKKQIAAVKNDMKTKKKFIAFKEAVDNDVKSENSVEDEEIFGFNKKRIDEVKNDEDVSKHNNNLITLMKIALREMANENFLLAKLPDCDQLPQLRIWIKYLKGFVASRLEKDELRDKIQNIGNELFDETSKIVAPQINLDKYQGTLNYSDINKLKHVVELKKKLFYSNVKKSRVNISRLAWNQLHFDNCLSDLLFKATYFIYQPAKEADGFMLKPYGFKSSVKKKKKK